jgi:alpha-2-macroglobulin
VLDMALLSGTALPPELRTRLEDGLQGFVEGRFRQTVWSPSATDAQVTAKLIALEALTRSGRHTAPVVRAASALDLNLQRLPTSALIDWWLVARRLQGLPERGTRLAAAERELRNRLAYAGGRLSFTTEKSDYWWWMMVSGDSNAFRLIEAVLDDPAWRDELPRLLRGALERQVRGRWFTTTANAWAVVALDGYAKRFEKDEVSGSTRAVYARDTAKAAEQRWKAGEDASPLALPWPAAADTLKLAHTGGGKPWANIQTLAAVPVTAPRGFGLKLAREVTPLQEKVPGKISRGDLWRVRLTVDAEQDMTWVALNDPIPAGARILGGGDGRDSRLATRDEDARSRRLWPTYVERSFGAYRAYYEVVPRGRFSIEYTLRLNNAGEFALPASRVEAMYAPDLFGELPNGRVTVLP